MSGENFSTDRHERLFQEVLHQLEALGYRGQLLARSYEFPDWFIENSPIRIAPAVAFGRTPQSYDSACFAVLLSNGKSGVELVTDYRALGAPVAFEVREDSVVYWKVGRDVAQMREELRIPPDALVRVFQEHELQWASKEVLRIKNIRFEAGPQQLEFDLGLIPALERHIQRKLDTLLKAVLAEAEAVYKRNTSREANAKDLFRLVFRFLAAKVLHDRGHAPFGSLSDFSNADDVLRMVGKYYGEQNLPLSDDFNTRCVVATGLWSLVDFRNLSVEVLAYIYENTLVDKQSRKELGTHSTPHNIARYIVHHLPFEKINQDEPLILEPFSGHAIFLVASLQRLRDLLPNDMDEKERHDYFVKRLRGYEIDAFAIEVSRLCLMLADFPNHNGWQLHSGDVFLSKIFSQDLRKAGIVLCNPPFEDFPLKGRDRYRLKSVHKPAELIHRVLAGLPASAMLGFVLPRTFLDGNSYRVVRELLVKRFDEIETVGLPDKVFHKSQQTSALLIAKTPRRLDRPVVSVAYTHVDDKDRDRFLSEYNFTRRDSEIKNLAAAQDSLKVVALREIWSRLERFPKLGALATIHRGIEWKQPFVEERYISSAPKSGFEQAFHKVEGIQCFRSPVRTFLCTKKEFRRGNAWELPWTRAKVLFNASRISRGQWCLAAFEDQTGLIASQNFHALWPDNHWTAKTFAALLNGPVANAFVAVRDSDQQRSRIKTVKDIPTPDLSPKDVEAIDGLVDKYVEFIRSVLPIQSNPPMPLWTKGEPLYLQRAKTVLLEIDAIILRSYGLPPRMERQLLNFFNDARTPRPLPFAFMNYFPESFVPTIPLWMYVSQDYENCSAGFFIRHAPIVDDSVVVEALKEVE